MQKLQLPPCGSGFEYLPIIELLGFRKKSIPAGDLNAKHPVWNSKVSYSSGLKLLESFDCSNFENFSSRMLYALHI
jgi:hypothetical protein